MTGIGWISMDTSSSLNSFLGNHPVFGFSFVLLNYPGFLVGMLISGNAHGGSKVWNCVGFFVVGCHRIFFCVSGFSHEESTQQIDGVGNRLPSANRRR